MANPHSTLETLTDDQKDQLFDWLLEMPAREVLEKLALPPGEGFGLKTNLTTLQRFKSRRWVEHVADEIQCAARLADTTAGHDTTLGNAITSGLKHHLFQLASAPDPTGAQLALVARWVHRQEKLQLDLQRLQLARERAAQNQRRLELLERAVKARELEAAARAAKLNPPRKKEDALGPLIRNPEDVLARAEKKFGTYRPSAPAFNPNPNPDPLAPAGTPLGFSSHQTQTPPPTTEAVHPEFTPFADPCNSQF